MRLHIKLTVLMLNVVAIATFLSLSTAEAHTVSRSACVKYAYSGGHHSKYERQSRTQKCLDWRARHNICQGVHHCQQWLQVAICESGNQNHYLTEANIASIRWTIHNSYEGGLQFNSGTWDARHTGYAAGYDAPPAVQMRAAEALRISLGGEPQSTAGWPQCGAWW